MDSKKELQKRIGQKLKKELINRGISAHDLAERVELPTHKIYNLYQGRGVNDSILNRVLGAVSDLSTDDLNLSQLPSLGVENALREDIVFQRTQVNGTIPKAEAYTKFIRNYFGRLTAIVNKAQHSIAILDYLADNRSLLQKFREFSEVGDIFKECYRNYLQALEIAVIERGVKYSRILQLPLSCHLNYEDEIAGLKTACTFMYPENLDHYCNLIGSSHFNLTITNIAVRPYTVFIVDDRILIREYDGVDKNKFLFPDLIEIETWSKPPKDSNEKFSMYSHLIENVATKKRDLTADDLDFGTRMAKLFEEERRDELLEKMNMTKTELRELFSAQSESHLGDKTFQLKTSQLEHQYNNLMRKIEKQVMVCSTIDEKLNLLDNR